MDEGKARFLLAEISNVDDKRTNIEWQATIECYKTCIICNLNFQLFAIGHRVILTVQFDLFEF